MMGKKYKRKFFDFKYVKREKRFNIIVACVFFCSIVCFKYIHGYLLGSVAVQGQSMSPTLENGERRIMHRWIYNLRDPQRGDIVVLKDPLDRTLSIKRIIGLPGDRVAIKGNSVYVNNKALAELYLPGNTITPPNELGANTYIVEDNRYFILGDNRLVSEDSRFLGTIPREDIQGIVFDKPK